MGIKIYADAGSNLFSEIIKKRNAEIKIMNMTLTVGEKVYNCYDDQIDVESFSQSFYQSMKQGDNVNTSQVNPSLLLKSFTEDVEQGHQIICFAMAKGISGTYHSACSARDEINERIGKEMVYVVDSMTAGFGEAIQAINAYQLVKQGLDFYYICQQCEVFKYRVRSEFTVGDIKYLIKKGRISSIVAKLINLIQIKFLLKASDKSKIEVAGKVQGRKRALAKIVETCTKKIVNPDEQIVYISHCNAYDDALIIKEGLLKKGIKNIEIYFHDLVTGAHLGPDSLALFYVGNNRS